MAGAIGFEGACLIYYRIEFPDGHFEILQSPSRIVLDSIKINGKPVEIDCSQLNLPQTRETE